MDQCRLSSLECYRRPDMVENLRHLGAKVDFAHCGCTLLLCINSLRLFPKHENVDRWPYFAGDCWRRFDTDCVCHHFRYLQYEKQNILFWSRADDVGSCWWNRPGHWWHACSVCFMAMDLLDQSAHHGTFLCCFVGIS